METPLWKMGTMKLTYQSTSSYLPLKMKKKSQVK